MNGTDRNERAAAIAWAHVMLDAASIAAGDDAKDAILTRVGAVLVATFGVWIDNNEMPTARSCFTLPAPRENGATT